MRILGGPCNVGSEPGPHKTGKVGMCVYVCVCVCVCVCGEGGRGESQVGDARPNISPTSVPNLFKWEFRLLGRDSSALQTNKYHCRARISGTYLTSLI